MTVEKLLANNRAWAAGRDPAVWKKLSEGQSPKYLWIGCSDSRVPPNEILGLHPGELFVHRNIAGLARTDDACFEAGLDFAVNQLCVEHVLICGHTGCAGVAAAGGPKLSPALEQWLAPVRKLSERSSPGSIDALLELTVREQVRGVCQSPVVQKRRAAGKSLSVHGWVFDIATGLIRDLNCQIEPA